MNEQKEGLAPAKGQAVKSKSIRPNHTANTARLRALLRYQAPDAPEPRATSLGPRDMELARALAAGPATRAALVKRGPPRLGLNAPQTVERLRAKGFDIETEWLLGTDAEGHTTRYGRYSLRGRLLGFEGAPNV